MFIALAYISATFSIALKYMLNDNFGLRLNVGWSYLYNRDNYFVQDDAAVFVKVTTNNLSITMFSLIILFIILSTNTAVFPLPAAAEAVPSAPDPAFLTGGAVISYPLPAWSYAARSTP